jgi:hypothetical protein
MSEDMDLKMRPRIRPRKIYLPDNLFERIIVQAHRQHKTISEYVAAVLDAEVSDHRTVRVDSADERASAV